MNEHMYGRGWTGTTVGRMLVGLMLLLAVARPAGVSAAVTCSNQPWIPFKTGSEIAYGSYSACNPPTTILVVLERWSSWRYVTIASYQETAGAYYNLGRRVPCNVSGTYRTRVSYGGFANYTSWSASRSITC